MNQVERRHLNEPILNIANSSDNMSNTTDPLDTSIRPNHTVIGTILKTGVVMQNIAQEEPIDHDFYIYVWALAIVGCILFTTGR